VNVWKLLHVFRRLCPLTCVCFCVSEPPRGYIFWTFRSSLFRHIPFSHMCTLSNTHFCSCCHCHFSRHATQKKGCHWQSVFYRYKDRSPKGNCNSTRYWGYTRVPNEPCCCLLGKEKFHKRPRPDSRNKGTWLLPLRQVRHPTRPGALVPKIIAFINLTYKLKTCCQETAEHTVC